MANVITKDNPNNYVLGTSCFGEFKVYLLNGDQELDWRTKKSKELFAYFIHMQGKPMGRDELIMRLWPNAYPNNAIQMLHNLIYSIRKESERFGINELIQYRCGKYHLNVDYVYSDLEEMLYYVEMDKKGGGNPILPYHGFLEGYDGAYLYNIDYDWSFFRREFFEKFYIKACLYLAGIERKKGENERALEYLKRALQVDPYSETVTEQILICYGEEKDLKSIKRYYDKYAELLEKDFSMKPGEQLKRVYRESLRNALT